MNDVFLLVGRSLRTYLRQPAAIIPNTAISVFFLFVYNAGLSPRLRAARVRGQLPRLHPAGGDRPSAAIGGASIAGQTPSSATSSPATSPSSC